MQITSVYSVHNSQLCTVTFFLPIGAKVTLSQHFAEKKSVELCRCAVLLGNVEQRNAERVMNVKINIYIPIFLFYSCYWVNACLFALRVMTIADKETILLPVD